MDMISSQTLAVPSDPPAVTLPRATLDEYVGTYKADDAFVFRITRSARPDWRDRRSTGLPHKGRAARRPLYPGQPRLRRIVSRDSNGKVTGLLIRREGRDLILRRVDSSPAPPEAPTPQGRRVPPARPWASPRRVAAGCDQSPRVTRRRCACRRTEGAAVCVAGASLGQPCAFIQPSGTEPAPCFNICLANSAQNPLTCIAGSYEDATERGICVQLDGAEGAPCNDNWVTCASDWYAFIGARRLIRRGLRQRRLGGAVGTCGSSGSSDAPLDTPRIIERRIRRGALRTGSHPTRGDGDEEERPRHSAAPGRSSPPPYTAEPAGRFAPHSPGFMSPGM